jgi:hypothetical protein
VRFEGVEIRIAAPDDIVIMRVLAGRANLGRRAARSDRRSVLTWCETWGRIGIMRPPGMPWLLVVASCLCSRYAVAHDGASAEPPRAEHVDGAAALVAIEPATVRRDPTMVHAAMVLSGLGGALVIVGGLGSLMAWRGDHDDLVVPALTAAGAGAVLLAVGVPLWIVGSSPREKHSALLTLGASPSVVVSF